MNGDLQRVLDGHARALVRKALGVPASDNFDRDIGPALCAEVLRAALWSLWSVEQRPVYVTRLLGSAARLLLPWPQDETEGRPAIAEQLRATLQELEIVGDLAALPRGGWVPAPLRSVHLPAIHRHIILGGVPTRLLPARLQATIERTGTVRLVPVPASDLKIDAIPEHEWLRRPSGDLAAWTRTVLDTTELGSAGDLAVEIYAPTAASAGADQYHRWQQRADRLPDGLYLARKRIRRGSIVHYYIVRIVAGRIDGAGTPALGDGDARRLMYGLDLLAKKPVRVLAQQRRGLWRVTLRSELPQAEQRLFLAIGREDVRPDGRYYPRCWELSLQYMPTARSALIALGVQIDER
mgnify:CR=1 FL=1